MSLNVFFNILKSADTDSDEYDTGSQVDDKDMTDPVLLTELGAEHYGQEEQRSASKLNLRMSADSSEGDEADTDEHDDDDDVLLTPKKTVNSIVYENDIYNEKKYETDLEGMSPG